MCNPNSLKKIVSIKTLWLSSNKHFLVCVKKNIVAVSKDFFQATFKDKTEAFNTSLGADVLLPRCADFHSFTKAASGMPNDPPPSQKKHHHSNSSPSHAYILNITQFPPKFFMFNHAQPYHFSSTISKRPSLNVHHPPVPPTNPRIRGHKSILLSAPLRGERVDPDPHSLGHVAGHWLGPTNCATVWFEVKLRWVGCFCCAFLVLMERKQYIYIYSLSVVGLMKKLKYEKYMYIYTNIVWYQNII